MRKIEILHRLKAAQNDNSYGFLAWQLTF